MKVICIQSCFYSQGLQRFDEGKEYDVDQKRLKEISDNDMAKYFTDELGESLADRKAKASNPPETVKTAAVTGEHKGR